MGKSYTVHCVGVPLGLAMSRLEIVQEERKAASQGRQISYWYAQTKTGERILGDTGPIPLERIPNLPKVVICPICEGDGSNGRYVCPVCNSSGVTRPGHERQWQQWQLDHMREERTRYDGTGVSLGGIYEGDVR